MDEAAVVHSKLLLNKVEMILQKLDHDDSLGSSHLLKVHSQSGGDLHLPRSVGIIADNLANVLRGPANILPRCYDKCAE